MIRVPLPAPTVAARTINARRQSRQQRHNNLQPPLRVHKRRRNPLRQLPKLCKSILTLARIWLNSLPIFTDVRCWGWHCLSRRFCNFSDRASRREYWSYTLIIKPCLVVASFIALYVGGLFSFLLFLGGLIGNRHYYMDDIGYGMASTFAGFGVLTAIGVLFALILMLIFSLHGLSVSVRRMHDAGKSGWWVLVPFASFFLLFKKSDEEWNIYGEPPVDDI